MSYLRLFHTDSSAYRALSVLLIDNVHIPFRFREPEPLRPSTWAQVLRPCADIRVHIIFSVAANCPTGLLAKQVNTLEIIQKHIGPQWKSPLVGAKNLPSKSLISATSWFQSNAWVRPILSRTTRYFSHCKLLSLSCAVGFIVFASWWFPQAPKSLSNH